MKRDKNEEAETEFRKALKSNPDDIESHYRLAEVLTARSLFQEAEKEIKLAILLRPNQASYHALLGDIYYRLNDHQNSLYEYKRAVSLSAEIKRDGNLMERLKYLEKVVGAGGRN
jgi:tetratricopeptide (TPR) repeat protein